MRSARLVVVLGALVLLILGVDRGTGAVWSDSGHVPGGPIHTGRVDLRVNGQDQIVDYAALDAALLVPGATVSSTLTVRNAGDIPLDYTIGVSGTGQAALRDALLVSGCGGAALPDQRTLSPGASEQVCVDVALPSSAPVAAAGGAATLTLTADASTRGWTDAVPVGGIGLSTVDLTPPELRCSAVGVGSVTVAWDPVPGATAYRVHSGVLGQILDPVTGGTLTKTLTGLSGVVSVEAVFGSPAWVSAPSQELTYGLVSGFGACA